MKRIYTTLLALLLFSSCERYLSIKPEKGLAVPNGLEDMKALLDATRTLNESRPSAQIIAADNIYLEDENWHALYDLTSKNAYVWERDVFNDFDTNDWTNVYSSVLHANVIIDGVSKVEQTPANRLEWEEIKGGALFHRAMSFYELAQLFAKPYDPSTASSDPGIVLRLAPSIDQKSVRASVEETYRHIIRDLNEALPLLPSYTSYATRPSKLAAMGLLARTYLSMQDYARANTYANEFLLLNPELMDYNELDHNSINPFSQFNEEVIYHSTAFGWPALGSSSCRVDTMLYSSYEDSDLRKRLFFAEHAVNRMIFKGSYNGSRGLFTGIATDEIYLIRAECQARIGSWERGMEDLNSLLEKRYEKERFHALKASDADMALKVILEERRKELVFRGLRWTDLRRLNKDVQFAKKVVRVIDGKVYELLPNSGNYIFSIPAKVIESSGIPQN